MRGALVTWILALSILLAACLPFTLTPTSTSTLPPPSPTYTPIPILAPVVAVRARATSSICHPGTFDLQLLLGKIIRKFRLHIPSEAANPAALLIVMHGLGGDSAGVEEYSGMSHLADANGFIVAYPQALETPSAWDLRAGPNPDVDFIDALISDLLGRCPVDPQRVYAAGFSRGGGMAARLACDLDRRVAAIAGVAGAYGYWTECTPERPLPVLAIHGRKDALVPYLGRPKLPTNAYSTPPLPEWTAAWASRNGCAPVPQVTAPSAEVEIRSWGACKQRADVVLYTLASAGHEWPSLPVNASQAIWDFFKEH